MKNIIDYRAYNSGMEKAMQDKLFWLDIVPTKECNAVLDYGCANGMFLRSVQKALKGNEHIKLYGIDIDPKMLYEAYENCPDAFLSLSENSIPEFNKGRSVLNLSSVIHEVYSYRTATEIKSFWNFVFNSGFKYICIRDMCISDTLVGSSITHQESMILNRAHDLSILQRMKDFQLKWGDIQYKNNFIHFMLKYRYVTNWDREVRENYLPLSHEQFLNIAPDNYKILYHEHFTLAFLKQKIQQDWKIDFNYKTHVKMVLELKE